jgi:hypothetical protein
MNKLLLLALLVTLVTLVASGPSQDAKREAGLFRKGREVAQARKQGRKQRWRDQRRRKTKKRPRKRKGKNMKIKTLGRSTTCTANSTCLVNILQ